MLYLLGGGLGRAFGRRLGLCRRCLGNLCRRLGLGLCCCCFRCSLHKVMSTGTVQVSQELTFLASVFALVVFLVDVFFTVAGFLVVEVALLGAAAGFFVVADLSVAVLALVAAAFLVSGAFFAEGAFLDGGLAFCEGLNDTTAREMVVMYLFGIGGHLGALRSEFDFA
jgi:hypothetical protein